MTWARRLLTELDEREAALDLARQVEVALIPEPQTTSFGDSLEAARYAIAQMGRTYKGAAGMLSQANLELREVLAQLNRRRPW